MKKILTLTALLYAAPVLALAQFGQIDYFFMDMMHFMNHILVPFIVTISLLVFIWGMFTYFIQGGANPESQAKGRQMIIYSVVGFVLMVSIWGIVNLFASGLSNALGPNQAPDLPALPGQSTNAGAPPPCTGAGPC